MESGNYAIQEGAKTVAYLQISKAGTTTLMPKGLKANALDTLHQAIDGGSLPKGYTARKMATLQ